ncbi:MAG: HDOD domain-containing protein [Thiohalorhabdaceae bacterium]
MRQLFLTRFPILDIHGDVAGYDISPRDSGEDDELAPDVLFNTLTGSDLTPYLDADNPTFLPLKPEVVGPNLLSFLPADYPLVLELEAADLLARGQEPPFAAASGMIHEHHFAAALRITQRDWEGLAARRGEEPPCTGWDYVVIPAEDAREGLGPGHFPGLAGEILVRGVTTPADFEFLSHGEFALYEGPFYAEPMDLSVQALRPDRAGAIRALNAVLRDQDVDRVVALLQDYPDLVLRLLGLLNSPVFRRTTKITSVERAVVLLGYRELSRWLSLLLFMGDTDEYQPSLLFREAYLRGALTQRVLERVGLSREDARGYLAGILAVLQALLHQPANRMAADLDLGDAIQAALIDRSGPIGEALAVVERLRGSDWLEEEPEVAGVALPVVALYGDESEVTRETIGDF